jgi:hypothetical protein
LCNSMDWSPVFTLRNAEMGSIEVFQATDTIVRALGGQG